MLDYGKSFTEILALYEKIFIFLQEVNKMWRKAKAFSAFLGNDGERETAEFLPDLECNTSTTWM